MNDGSAKGGNVRGKVKYTLEELDLLWRLNLPHFEVGKVFLPKNLYWETFQKFHAFTSTYFPAAKLSAVVDFLEMFHRSGLNMWSEPEVRGFSPFAVLNFLDTNEGLLGREISTLNVCPFIEKHKRKVSDFKEVYALSKGGTCKGYTCEEGSCVVNSGLDVLPGGAFVGGLKNVSVKGVISELAYRQDFFFAFPLGFARNPNTPVEKLNELIEHEESTVRTAAYVSLQILSAVDKNFQPILLQK